MTTPTADRASARSIHAIVVTYRRPDVVRETVSMLMRQTRPPDTLVVVDNDPSDELARWVETLRGATYVAASENLGPAGGIARGMSDVLSSADDDDLVLLVDDDDPPPTIDAVAGLVDFLDELSDERVGVVGLVGARFDRRRALMVRVADDELSGSVDVDCIAGNQLPLYRARCLNDVGVFDADLFFGFEELDFCLRVRDRGWRVVVCGSTMRERRTAKGRLGLGARATGSGLPPWRRYYSARNIIIVARRFGGHRSMAWALAHAGAGAAARALLRKRRHEAWYALRGAVDGARGRVGRTVEPHVGAGDAEGLG